MSLFSNRKPNFVAKPAVKQVVRPVRLDPAIDKDTGSPSHVLRAVITLIDELVALMNQEVKLVELRRGAEHAELLKKKQRLTVDYRAALKSIALQPNLLKQVPDDLRNAAKAAASRLAEASEKNSRLLRTAIVASQQLIQTIVGLVKEEVMPKNAYGNPFGQKQLRGAYSPTCQPVTGVQTV